MADTYKDYTDKEIRLLLAPLAARLIPDILTKPDKTGEAAYLTLLGMYDVQLDELCKRFKQTHQLTD